MGHRIEDLPEEREALLDDWGRRLDAAVQGGQAVKGGQSPFSPPPEGGQSPFSSPEGGQSPFSSPEGILLAAAHTIRTLNLPIPLFHDLLSAFRQDVRVKRYATWDEVLEYCRRSANPVGRLVLRIGGYASPELDRASDAVCTALQLTNFWQDLERDWNNGRLYVPAADLAATGARQEDLDNRRWTPQWRATLARVAGRTRALFADGKPIADHVSGRLKWELRLTWLGGVRILDTLERRGFDVFDRRPVLSKADAPSLMWRTLFWRTRRTAGGAE